MRDPCNYMETRICESHGCKLKVENVIVNEPYNKIYTCCEHYGVFQIEINILLNTRMSDQYISDFISERVLNFFSFEDFDNFTATNVESKLSIFDSMS